MTNTNWRNIAIAVVCSLFIIPVELAMGIDVVHPITIFCNFLIGATFGFVAAMIDTGHIRW